ncbi:MAG: phosphoserine phosphatase SerB [Methanobrevibacter sp.]|nr:phosphoserine phosphatase SerB [Candidatus Methanovirga australis]
MIKLVIFDLDNVIIDGEAIDEIGKLVNVQDEIVEITEKAMNGDLDFETSIKERVKLLTGASVEDIKKLAEDMKLMKGAEETIKNLKSEGYLIAIISGSFNLIANNLKEKLNVDFLFTNTLAEDDGKLTGEVTGPLVKDSKADVLKNLINKNNILLEECVAIGDGANDISMLEASGLSIAFNAKPPVKEIADIVVEDKDLTKVLEIIKSKALEDKEKAEEESEEKLEEESKENVIEEKSVNVSKLSDDGSEKKTNDEKSANNENGEKDAKSKKKSKKKRKKLPKTDFVPANGFLEVMDQKNEHERLILEIADARDEFNRISKEQRLLRDKLNDSLKENLKLASEFKAKRNKINEEVEKYKQLRNKTNNEIKKLEFSSGKKDMLNIEKEIEKIDKIIETNVLDIKKENQLVNKANDLRKQVNEFKEDAKIKAVADKLKEESEEYHAKVVELSENAQEFHDKMVDCFKKTNEIRSKADESHESFIKSRHDASSKHEDFKNVLSEIHVINSKLNSFRGKRKSINKESDVKQAKEEKEKAENIFERFKKGKKLTTDELLLLQRHNIS